MNSKFCLCLLVAFVTAQPTNTGNQLAGPNAMPDTSAIEASYIASMSAAAAAATSTPVSSNPSDTMAGPNAAPDASAAEAAYLASLSTSTSIPTATTVPVAGQTAASTTPSSSSGSMKVVATASFAILFAYMMI